MKNKNYDMIVLSGIALLMSIVVILVLSYYGNCNQAYTDVISEVTSINQSNKSIEMSLVYGISFLGMLLYAVYYFIMSKRDASVIQNIENSQFSIGKVNVIALVSISLICFVIYQSVYTLAIGAILYVIVCFFIDRSLVGIGFMTYFMSVYSVSAIQRICIYLGSEQSVSTSFVAVIALIIALTPLSFPKAEKQLLRLCMAEGVVIPFTLLLFLMDKYKLTDGSVIEIQQPQPINITIFLIIGVFFVEASWRCIKFWSKDGIRIADVINIGTCVAIIGFNRFSGMGAVLSTDLHHPYENVIGFTQIFELGQQPFENFIPISGMYSIIHGAILHFWGNEQFSNYYTITELFLLFIAIIIVLLLRKNIEKEILFLISVTFFLHDYNRVLFLLPIALLLSSPTLIKNKNRWLNAWFLSSLFHGLYYPLYGVASCIGFMPFGVYQFVTYIKSGLYKREIKTTRFWIGWGISIVLFIGSVKYLIGILWHMLAMSGQSVLADGISRFGQALLSSMFPYLDGATGIQYVLYYILTWIVPAILIWVCFACMLRSGKVLISRKKGICVQNIEPLCMFSSIVIILLISFSFTFIRLDVYDIYARSLGVFLAVCVMLIVYACRYSRNDKSMYYIVGLAIAIPVITNVSGISNLDWKLAASYTVPEGYVYVENDSIEKLGTSFVEQGMYDTLKAQETLYAGLDRSRAYFGSPGWFGYYYYADIKGAASIEISPTVKGLAAAEEAIDYIVNNNAIVGSSLDPFANYYFYHWLVASGEYYWNASTGEFYPNDIYTKEEVLEQHKNLQISYDGLDIGRQASSFGESMESLSKIFTSPEISYELVENKTSADIILSEPIDGNEADWMYVEFRDMNNNFDYAFYDMSGQYIQQEEDLSWLEKLMLKKDYNVGMVVDISWEDEAMQIHNLRCNMSKGKLLIPLGSGLKWLLNSHQSIHITVFQDGQVVNMPDIESVKLLKLREAH